MPPKGWRNVDTLWSVDGVLQFAKYYDDCQIRFVLHINVSSENFQQKKRVETHSELLKKYPHHDPKARNFDKYSFLSGNIQKH